MPPRASSSIGCSGLLSTIVMLFVSYGFIRLGAQTPSRSYSLLDLWVIVTTLALPIAYLGALFGARKIHQSSLPDPDIAVLFSDPNSGRNAPSERLAAFSLTVLGLAIYGGLGWFLVNRFLSNTTFMQRAWWATFATIGFLLAITIGYRLGAVRMEDRRRFVIAGMLVFIVGGGLPYLSYLWNHRTTLPTSFWIGAPLGVGSIALTWWYLTLSWDPATLSSNPTRIDGAINRLTLFLVGLAGTGVFMTLDIFCGDSGWMLSWLGPLLLFVLSYMIIQAWRYRPREAIQI